MTQQQQEEVNLLKELIADSSISADERMIYEDALSELMKSEKPKASTERKRLINDIKPQKTTERKPRTTTQRKPQAPKQSKSDIESAKAEIKRRTGKTEEECESIVNEYRSLRAKSVERKKKESVASAENKDRVAKLKKDDKIISGTSEKTADAVIESTTKDVAEKIVKEIDKIEQKAEVEATKEVKKEMPKESTTEQNKVIAEKTEEKVKAQTKTIVKRIVIDTSSLLTSIAESLGKFDKDSQKEFLIKLRSDIDKLLTKYSYGGSTMGATQGYNITQSNMSSSSVNPTMFNGGGGVDDYIDAQVNEFRTEKNAMRQQYRGYVRDIEYQGFLAIDTSLTPNERLSDYEFEGEEFDRDNLLEVAKKYPQAEYITFHARLMGDSDFGIEDELSPIDDLAMEFDMDKLNQFKKGGNVYNRSWHQDHERFNKNEDYEIPLSSRKKKMFNGGGGVDKFEVGENAHLSNGQKNKMYLDSLRMTYKQAILENISKSYGGISIEQVENEVYDNDAEMLYEYITNNDNLRKRVYGEQATIYSNFKKGGNVYNRSWHQDHERFNKNENYEVPLSSRKKKMFDEGGGVENGYMVFNYTDNLYANYDIFATKKEANNFIKEFRNRYKQQGYYRDSNMNKIDVEDIDLEIIPSDFNPFRKFNGGGGVDGNPSKKEMLDYLNMYFDNYSELRTIAIEEDNILTRKMLNSLDDEELEMAYDDAKYEIKADTQFKNGGGVEEKEDYFFDEDDYENN